MPTQNICTECSDAQSKDLENGLPSAVEESIKSIIAKEGYVEYNIQTKELNTNGGNYLGLLYEVDITGKTTDGEKETNVFVKCVLPGENQIKFISLEGVYNKELYVYNEISRIFTKIQDEANVPLEERYNFVKCYDESNTEAILLDNLAKKGFKTCQRMDVMTYEFSLSAIQELAKFHALSFVVKANYPEYFEKNIKTVKPALIQCDDWLDFVESMYNQTIEYLDCNTKMKVEKGIRSRVDQYIKYYDNPATKYCLCHGDYKPGNIMIKETNGEAPKVVPIDYQLMDYGNPLIDVFFLIFMSTDRQFRKDHLEELKSVYFESLTKFLQYFDLDVENIFPRNVFEKLYAESLDYGITIASLVLPFIFVSEDNVPDVTKKIESNLCSSLNHQFKERYQGIIEDFIEWGYL